jgi:hypothetical protein
MDFIAWIGCLKDCDTPIFRADGLSIASVRVQTFIERGVAGPFAARRNAQRLRETES